jgi:hypothetical protein
MRRFLMIAVAIAAAIWLARAQGPDSGEQAPEGSRTSSMRGPATTSENWSVPTFGMRVPTLREWPEQRELPTLREQPTLPVQLER